MGSESAEGYTLVNMHVRSLTIHTYEQMPAHTKIVCENINSSLWIVFYVFVYNIYQSTKIYLDRLNINDHHH